MNSRISSTDTKPKLSKEAPHTEIPNDDAKKEQEANKTNASKKEPCILKDVLDQMTEESIWNMAENEIEKSLGPFT